MLIKYWFGLMSVILVVTLLTLIFSFNIANVFHWISLIALTIAVALTILVYLEKPYKKEVKQLQKTYSDFLAQKDSQIEELQKKGDLMFKTSMKKSEQDIELAELKKRLEEQTKSS